MSTSEIARLNHVQGMVKFNELSSAITFSIREGLITGIVIDGVIVRHLIDFDQADAQRLYGACVGLWGPPKCEMHPGFKICNFTTR